MAVVNSTVSITHSTSSAFAGAISGYSHTSLISNCYNTGDVNIKTDYVAYAGGITGNSDSPLDFCYNTGVVSAIATNNMSNNGWAFVGGIAGSLWSTINNCFNTGDINATADSKPHAGGITGELFSASAIMNCYNKGNISALALPSYSTYAYAGGIAGAYERSHISNCYSTGTLNAVGAGGIVGVITMIYPSTPLIINAYYLNNIFSAFGRNNSGGSLTDVFENVNILTSTQMCQQDSFVGFDFDNVWAINPVANNGYPYLRGTQS